MYARIEALFYLSAQTTKQILSTSRILISGPLRKNTHFHIGFMSGFGIQKYLLAGSSIDGPFLILLETANPGISDVNFSPFSIPLLLYH